MEKESSCGVAFVTGAGSGIGLAVAQDMLRRGMKVAAADVDADRIARVVTDLGRMAGNYPHADTVMGLQVDVTSVESIEAAVEKVVAEWGYIDVLVNSAGINIRKPILEITESDWDRVINANLKGTYFCSRAVGRHMVKRGKGKIVNLASIQSEKAMPMLSVYCISKAGVAQLTRAFAVEFAPYHVNVNAVAPAYAHTNLTATWLADDDRRRSIVERTPLGRLASVGDVVAAVAFLTSPQADFITGHVLLVDGGWSARW